MSSKNKYNLLSLNLKSGLSDERLEHIPEEWYTSDPSTAIQAQRTGNLTDTEFEMLQDYWKELR